jgi:hypothetical protein
MNRGNERFKGLSLLLASSFRVPGLFFGRLGQGKKATRTRTTRFCGTLELPRSYFCYFLQDPTRLFWRGGAFCLFCPQRINFCPYGYVPWYLLSILCCVYTRTRESWGCVFSTLGSGSGFLSLRCALCCVLVPIVFGFDSDEAESSVHHSRRKNCFAVSRILLFQIEAEEVVEICVAFFLMSLAWLGY